jgi:predicted TIM-barrel fold metal-dependent hydrolase
MIEDFGIRGFKFHPTMQGFFPNDKLAYPLYEVIADAGAISLFHTG